jgi:hypothetical protein
MCGIAGLLYCHEWKMAAAREGREGETARHSRGTYEVDSGQLPPDMRRLLAHRGTVSYPLCRVGDRLTNIPDNPHLPSWAGSSHNGSGPTNSPASALYVQVIRTPSPRHPPSSIFRATHNTFWVTASYPTPRHLLLLMRMIVCVRHGVAEPSTARQRVAARPSLPVLVPSHRPIAGQPFSNFAARISPPHLFGP